MRLSEAKSDVVALCKNKGKKTIDDKNKISADIKCSEVAFGLPMQLIVPVLKLVLITPMSRNQPHDEKPDQWN